MPDDRGRTARRTFGPVVLVGLAAAVLSAVAGHQPWARAHSAPDSAEAGLIAFAAGSEPGELPAAGALALVVLACWGVVLVSRGRFRRAVAVVGVVAGLAVLVLVVLGYQAAPEAVRDAVAEVGVTDPDVSRTGWYWAAAVSAVVTVFATGLAVRWAPFWPEMGQRYDAPSAGPAGPVRTPEQAEQPDQSDASLWKAIDDGRDPTV